MAQGEWSLMKHEEIKKQLNLLCGQGASFSRGNRDEPLEVDREMCARWILNCQTLIRSAFGEDSPLYKAIMGLKDFGSANTAQNAAGIIGSAKDAWDRGLAFDVQSLVRADIEAGLIDQATTLHAAGYDLPAAVVAGAVLEQHLRSVAPSWGVATHNADGKAFTIEPLNVELKKAGAYDAILQKKVTYLAGLRNDAAHGNPFANRSEDVRGMIRDVLDICDRVKTK
jgi:hypothetical protein